MSQAGSSLTTEECSEWKLQDTCKFDGRMSKRYLKKLIFMYPLSHSFYFLFSSGLDFGFSRIGAEAARRPKDKSVKTGRLGQGEPPSKL